MTNAMPMQSQTATTLDLWADLASGDESNYHCNQIDKRDKLSQKEFIHEYVQKGRPVVLKDAAADWPALKKWTPEFFSEKYGSKRVPVFERKRAVTQKDTVLFRDYIKDITAENARNRAKYLFSLRIAKEFPELLDDLSPRPSYWDPNWLDSKYLLPGLPGFKLRNITGLEMNMGGPGSVFPFLHFDDLLTQTFITQVQGRKAWILFKPDQTPYMYPTDDAENVSRVPMDEDVDLRQFPLFSKAETVKVIVEPGEMLYGPPGWWHTTRALNPSIAVVLSTANGAIWGQVTQAAFWRALKSPKMLVKPAAFPIAAYMTTFRAVKSFTDPV